MYQYHALQEQGIPAAAGGSHGNVMGDVSAGAVTGKKKLGEIRMGSEPGLGLVARIGGRGAGLKKLGLAVKPEEGMEAVIVSGREAVFGSETIVNGYNKDLGVSCELAEEAMVGRNSSGTIAETAAMEIEKDRELGGGGGRSRYEEAS